MRRNIYISILVLAGWLASVLPSIATHIRGGDTEFYCLNTDTFVVRLTLYRDCTGIPYDNSVVITVEPVTGQNPGASSCATLTLTASKVACKDVTNLCKSACKPCSQTSCNSTVSLCQQPITSMGIEQIVYEGKMIFPKNMNKKCCYFRASYSICCRNSNITTGSAGQTFFTYVEVNRCSKPCLSSPSFKNIPVSIFCRGKCQTMNLGAADGGNHDSLSYHISKSLNTTYTDPVTYNSPNSYQYPLSGFVPSAGQGGNTNKPWLKVKNQACSGFFLDSVFGDIIFKPTKIEQGPLAVDVKVWRMDTTVKPNKMKVVAVVRRDVQIIIRDTCPNEPPILAGPFLALGCSGDNICFTDMEVHDSDKAGNQQRDSTFVKYNGGIPKATFSKKQEGKNEYWSLCWQTTDADASTNPYFFNITANDNFCPFPGVSSRNYAIFVKKTPKDDRFFTQTYCDSCRLSAIPVEKNLIWASGYQYEWTVPYPGGTKYGVKDTTLVFPPGKTAVKHRVEFGGCFREYIDTVTMPERLVLTADPDTFVCQYSDITFHVSQKDGAGVVRYFLNNNITDSVGQLADSFLVTINTDTTFYITATDTLGCISTDSIFIHAVPAPVIELGPRQRVCWGDSMTLDAGNNNGAGIAVYDWRKVSTPTIKAFSTRTITIGDSNVWFVKVTDSFGCSNRDTVPVFVNDSVRPKAGPDKVACQFDTITFIPKGAAQYEWIDINTNDTLSISDTGFRFVVLNSTKLLLHGSVTFDSVYCEGWDTVDIKMNVPATLDLKIPEKCVDQIPTSINLIVVARDPANKIVSGTYVWVTFDTTLQKGLSGSTVDKTKVGSTYPWNGGPTGPNVRCIFTDVNGCVTTDSAPVIIHPIPPTKFAQKAFCVNLPPFNLTGHGYPGSLFVDPTAETWVSVNDGTGSKCSGCVYKDANAPNYWQFDPQKALVGANIISYTFKDPNGCDETYVDTFWVKPIPVLTFNQPGPICNQDGVVDLWKLTSATPADGVWFDDFNLKSGIALADSSTGLFDPNKVLPVFNVGAPSVTHKIIFMSRGAGCPIKDTVYITINPVPAISLPPDKLMCLDAPPYTLPNISNTSWWLMAGEDSATTNGRGTFDPKLSGVGKHYLRYLYRDPITSCFNTDSFAITVQDTPYVKIKVAAPVCQDEPISLDCDLLVATDLLWSTTTGGLFTTPDQTSTTYIPNATDIANGRVLFTVETKNSSPCAERRDTLTVIINPRPIPALKGDTLKGCSPHTVNFNFTGDSAIGSRYKWDFGDTSSGVLNNDTNHSPTHIYINNSGQVLKYSVQVTVTSPEGCDSTLLVKDYIEVYPMPIADFDPRPKKATIALPRIRFQNLSKNTDELTKWNWEFGDPAGGKSTERNPTYWYTNTDTGTYIVWMRAETQYGCWDTVEKPVFIGPEMTVFIPNAFTPDNFGPGKNNFFWVEADNYKGFEMFIFNRWGEEVFYADQRLPGWNGMYQGKPAQEDVYVYQVNIQNLEGKWYHYNGTVTLLR
jgi:gliding motility-associated-like protein